MKKSFTYIGFAVSCLLVVAVFVTAKNYIQLAIAVILYPLLAYFAIKLFPQSSRQVPATLTIQPQTIQPPPFSPVNNADDINKEKVEIVDIDKRTFLKLIGTAGISFFLFSLLGRRADELIFGNAIQSGMNKIGLTPEEQTGDAQPISSEGYRISEIDDNIVSYYGFINKDGNWLIMREDTETSSFRYAKGDSKFSDNWKKRESLQFDYYYNLF